MDFDKAAEVGEEKVVGEDFFSFQQKENNVEQVVDEKD